MSNVQQALALGRKRFDQNVYYQYTSIEEDTATHQEFLAFNSHQERIDFLHTQVSMGMGSRQLLLLEVDYLFGIGIRRVWEGS